MELTWPRKTLSTDIQRNQYFFSHGKLLLSAEYMVLKGAMALALPVKLGQSLSVSYRPSFSPKLIWVSKDDQGREWMRTEFEFWRFNLCEERPATKEELFLRKILQQVRRQNPHFLRDEGEVVVETRLGFPLRWGLGSSSTLIHNIACWAHVDPFELLFNVSEGSGYDIACARGDGPLLYQRGAAGPFWEPIHFHPHFRDGLYFVYLGHKAQTANEIEKFKAAQTPCQSVIQEISDISLSMAAASSMVEFNTLLERHEFLLSKTLQRDSLRKRCFSDFPGGCKSLGAWGGDFALFSFDGEKKEFESYLLNKGVNSYFCYDDLVMPPDLASDTQGDEYVQ